MLQHLSATPLQSWPKKCCKIWPKICRKVRPRKVRPRKVRPRKFVANYGRENFGREVVAIAVCQEWLWNVIKYDRENLEIFQNSNLFVLKNEKLQPNWDASANIAQEASTFWRDASVDQDSFALMKIGPRGALFRRRWGSFTVNNQQFRRRSIVNLIGSAELNKNLHKKRFK